MGKKRIAHIITDLEVGGAEGMLTRLLLGGLEDFEHLVVCMTEAGPLAAELTEGGIDCVPLGMPRGRPSAVAAWAGLRTLRRFAPDILQTWMYHADFYGTVLAPLCRCPPVVWNLRCVDMDFSRYSSLTGKVVNLLARMSALPRAVIANSAAGVVAHCELGYHPREWQLIPNGFDTQLFSPDPNARVELCQRLGFAVDQPLIGVVARNDPAKDFPTLLAALSALRAGGEHINAYLVGPNVPAMAPEIAALGLSDRVFVDDARRDLERVYPGLDALVLSSAFGEGFPNVLGEAMACGCICVSTDVGDAREIVGETGLIVSRRNPDQLAVAIREIVGLTKQARAERGHAARTRIVQRYSLASVAERYADLYSNILATSGPAEKKN